jgi:hypothetical protein
MFQYLHTVLHPIGCRAEREGRDRAEREDKKAAFRRLEDQKKEAEKKRKEEEEMRSYANIMKPDKMKSNKEAGSDSDDFM